MASQWWGERKIRSKNKSHNVVISEAHYGEDSAEYEDLPPMADSMVASMRAIGYDLPMAIADLIDNSIYANAKNIWLDFDWADGEPWVRLKDDGLGMQEEELRAAMRLGSRGANEERNAEDLGRFGLGLKTASFSQCRVFTVVTKTVEGTTSRRCWDLDVIERTREWKLSLKAPSGSEPLLNLDDVNSGTIVLWQKLDRLLDDIKDPEEAESVFRRKFIGVGKHLEMVFHRYFAGPHAINIFIGRTPMKPWDPYLLRNSFTQELSGEKYEDGSVCVTPYVLPHVSKRSPGETTDGGGPKGWNAQQGFYVYRNHRLIVSGGYLDLSIKPEEHYKLARIRVDLKNNMDHEWHIDVRKAVAIPPDRLRAELEKVARATREEAVKVYRARAGKVKGRIRKNTNDVWLKRRRGDKLLYEINRENDAIKCILDELSPPDQWIRKLFSTIERTIPFREILIDTSGNEDCHVDLPSDVKPPEPALIELCKDLYLKQKRTGKSHQVAMDIILSIEPFDTHPAFATALDNIMEGEE